MSKDTKLDIGNIITVLVISTSVGLFIGWITLDWIGYIVAFIFGATGVYEAYKKSKERRQ